MHNVDHEDIEIEDIEAELLKDSCEEGSHYFGPGDHKQLRKVGTIAIRERERFIYNVIDYNNPRRTGT